MKPSEQENRLARAGAELDAMMRLFDTDRESDSREESPDAAYEARKRRDVAELVFRIEALRRRRRLHRLVASACGVAACVAIWLALPSDDGKTADSIDRYEVPVLIVDNNAPIALTPGPGSTADPSREIAQAGTAETSREPETSGTATNGSPDEAAPEPSLHRILVPAGQTYALQLPDGSRVVMNAESSVSYTVPFAASLRELTLQGEAYFEIAPSEIPFEVVAGTARIRVYGTRFNVKESAQRDNVTAVLAEGSIGMRLPDGRELRMEPDQLVSFDTASGDVSVQRVDSETYLAWTNDRFKYTDAALGEVLDDLTRWYGVKLVCPDAGETRLTLDVSRRTSLESLLADLELLVGKKIVTEKRLPMKK